MPEPVCVRIGDGADAAATTTGTNIIRSCRYFAVDTQITVQPNVAAPGAGLTDTITVANVGQEPAQDVSIARTSAEQLLCRTTQPESLRASIV